MIENWKDVSGYEGVYQVSDLGRVRSVDRVIINSRGFEVRLKGKQIHPSSSKFGHKRVVLYSPGIPAKTIQIHTLVLNAFVGPRPKGLIGRHLNGVPDDNRASNLRWGTPSENMFDKSRHGTDHQRNKTHCPLGHELVEPNLQERKLREGWRACKACHQATSDLYNGSSLSYQELADIRHYMILTGKKYKYGTRRAQEAQMLREAVTWKEEPE